MRHPLPTRVLASLFAVAALTAALPLRAQTTAAQPTMPSLIGLPVDSARQVLQRFQMQATVREADSRRAAGTVIAQEPAAGSPVRFGAAASLTVSRGPAVVQRDTPQRQIPTARTVTVPDVTGLTLAVAAARLAAAGLMPLPSDPTATRSTVASQSPAAGAEVRRGSGVRLAMAPRETETQQELVVVPDVSGRALGDARAAIFSGRLAVGEVDSISSREAPGTVLRQQPAAGSRVAPGTRVTLTVSEARFAVVPRLVGEPEDRARQLLENAGLRVGEVSGRDNPAPLVVDGHTHQPGDRVLAGTVINLSLETRPSPVQDLVQVPDLSGRSLAAARSALSSGRLALGGVDTIQSRRTPGTVVGQQPAAGTRVAPGTRVSLALSQPRMAVVPDVVGEREDRARRMILDAGLRVGRVTGTGQAEPRIVARQATASGRRVPEGTAIDLQLEAQVVVTSDTTSPRVRATVPDVTNRRLAEASGVLLAAGFTVTVDSAAADTATWIVAAQDPAGGTEAEGGASVRLAVTPPVAPVSGGTGTGTETTGGGVQEGPGPVTGPEQTEERTVDEGTRFSIPLWVLIVVAVVIGAAAVLFGAKLVKGKAAKAAKAPAAVRVQAKGGIKPQVSIKGEPFSADGMRLRARPGVRVAKIVGDGAPFARKERIHV